MAVAPAPRAFGWRRRRRTPAASIDLLARDARPLRAACRVAAPTPMEAGAISLFAPAAATLPNAGREMQTTPAAGAGPAGPRVTRPPGGDSEPAAWRGRGR